MSKGWKTLAIWSVLLLLFFGFYSIFSRQSPPQKWRPVEAFEADIEADQVTSVTPEPDSLFVTNDDGSQYRVHLKLDDGLWKNLASHGVRLEPPKQSDS